MSDEVVALKYSKINPIPDDAPRFIERECRHHGTTRYVLFTRSRYRKDGTASKSYRCVRCNATNKTRHRAGVRQALIDELGGCCIRCGYNRCQGALHFHHRDPAAKAFEISKLSTSLKRARSEVAKCDLVCSNCHAEIHADMM